MSSVFVSILSIVAALNIAIFFLQPGMVFFPYRGINETPADWGLHYEDVLFRTSDDIQLHGWYIPHPDAKLTVLFFHGNAGNISHRGDSVKIFHRLGLNVFISDYRGYGRSEGKPSEAGLYEDAHSAWRYLLSVGVQRENIILFGRSLGGAVATKLAADVQPGALILESAFSSAEDMAKSILPGLSWLVYLRFNFDNIAMIKRVHCPLLVMHSPDDEIIPFELGEKVFLAANRPKKFIQLQGSHNSGFLQSQPDYELSLENFILTLDAKL
ncbi:MAG: alpha/beta hydrolase [Gammaproteobacteria bacterium]|nr:alpha/beta hydrolase [Gammaproteobacteria bacterium]